MRQAALSLIVALAGCAAYQAEPLPPKPGNLPVSHPLWTHAHVTGVCWEDVHMIVSASGACGDVGVRPRRRLLVESGVDVHGSTILDFVAGLTLTTFPAFRWHEVWVRADVLEATGTISATVEGRSTVGVVIGWPMVAALLRWTDLDVTDEVRHNVQVLARAVVGEIARREQERAPSEPDPLTLNERR